MNVRTSLASKRKYKTHKQKESAAQTGPVLSLLHDAFDPFVIETMNSDMGWADMRM